MLTDQDTQYISISFLYINPSHFWFNYQDYVNEDHILTLMISLISAN